MKTRHITQISAALLLARWKQTLVAAIGVTFSIMLFIVLLGFMEGLNSMLDGLVMNRTPHVRLYNEVEVSDLQPVDLSDRYRDHYNFVRSVKPSASRTGIYNARKIIQSLENDPRVRGVAPRATAQVLYNLGNVDLNGVINGVDAEQEARLFFFTDYITGGNYLDLENVPESIILGTGAAEIMLAEPGDMITVTTPGGDQFPLKVVGIFQSGIADLDRVQSFASLETTQKILGQSSHYMNDIQIKLHDLEQAPALARRFEELYKVDAEDLQTANAQYETGSDIRSIISYAVGLTLLIVSGFGIYNILNMLIYEKMDTIAILKATGFSAPDVKQIFLIISVSIGLAGALVGALLGFGMSTVIDAVPFETEALPTVETYPIDYGLQFYAIAISFALVTTWLAGWLPARKAGKLDPVDIIRGK